MKEHNVEVAWLVNGRTARQIEDTMQIAQALPKKVYALQYNDRTGELYLEEFDDEFHFNFKVYGMETMLINHIMKTFESTKGNLGILFNGVKGTGKTITAKILANKMNLPVILVNSPYPGLADFISKVNSEVILFFDEYEKNFKKESGSDTDLLSIMDGVFNSPYRRVFLLTTNNMYVNENMIGRPSRIRYRKSFGNLQPEVVKEYLDDNLINKDYIPEIIDFIDTLALSTIDILKAIVDELNIHDLPISKWKSIFNVENAKYSWTVSYKRTYDQDYTVEKFEKELASIGTTAKDENGKEYVIDEDDVDIYTRKVNTTTHVDFLQPGENFGGWGTIVTPLNEKGIIEAEDSDSERYFFKVHNLENKPSLYRGALVY